MNKIKLTILLVISCFFSFGQITPIPEDNVFTDLTNINIELSEGQTLIFSGDENNLQGAKLTLSANSDQWVCFENIKPSKVLSSYLSVFSVDGNALQNKINARVTRYKNGSLIIPQNNSYNALTVYKEENLSGDQLELFNTNLYTDNRSHTLSDFDNQIKSFVLKRGYMATFADGADGTGYSRVYIAKDEDLVINKLPETLNNKISFIKVFAWRWTRKKGWCGGGSGGDVKTMDGDWWYAWNAGGVTTADIEYVPMRHNGSWPGYTEITKRKESTHVLGFNEPTHKDQADMTVEQQIKQWPNLLKTGFRLGSPAPADDGYNQLYEFIAECEKLNYRVDFIALHWYRGNQSPKNFYNTLKTIHKKCGNRPLWITEWNNGAGWTDKQEKVTQEIQERELPGFLEVLDTTSFVERYAIYNWVGEGRAMIKNGITPAGYIYKNNDSPLAFNEKFEFVPNYLQATVPYNTSYTIGNDGISLSWKSTNTDASTSYVVERKIGDGSFEQISSTSNTSYTDTDELKGEVKYRIKAVVGDVSSAYSENIKVFILTTIGDDTIQMGKFTVEQDEDNTWNTVKFSQTMKSYPSVVAGVLSNNGSSPTTVRIKDVSLTGFKYRLNEWQYDDKSHTVAETISFLAMTQGSHNLSGLDVEAKNINMNNTDLKSVNFLSTLNNPVLFSTQITDAGGATTVTRISNVTNDGYSIKVQEEEGGDNSHSNETVSVIAIESGKANIFGNDIWVSNSNYISSNWLTFNFDGVFDNPGCFAKCQTTNDNDAGNLRYSAVSNNSITLKFVEEKSKDSEVLHQYETLGILIIDDINNLKTLSVNNELVRNDISVYPNPFTSVINIRSENDLQIDEIKIIDATGKLYLVTKDTVINTNSFPKGLYIINIKTPRGVVSKKLLK